MNKDMRDLIYYTVYGNNRMVKHTIHRILDADKSKKDESFCKEMLCELDKRDNIEIPSKIKGMIIPEDVSSFREDRFFIRDSDYTVVESVLNHYNVSEKLSSMGINHPSTLILYGDSGCGKTMLTKYIAYKQNLPYFYINFSQLIDSYLGNTSKSLNDIFTFVNETKCLLCIDEIDAIGIKRDMSNNEVGEVRRIVISIMQELDRLSNDVILVACTNKFNMIDDAIVRRFSYKHKLEKYNCNDCFSIAKKFFDSLDNTVPKSNLYDEFTLKFKCDSLLGYTASNISDICIEILIQYLLSTDN